MLKMLNKLLKSIYVRLIPGTIILIIVIGGSIQSYLDFLKQNIWLNIGVVFLSLIYIIFTNIDKLKSSVARTPNLSENFFITNETIKVDKLNQRSELLAMHKLALKAFGKEAMTLEKIQELHWHSKETVFLLKNDIGDVIGYLALFVPTNDLKTQIFEGNSLYLNPMNWETNMFSNNESWDNNLLYLESIVVEGKGPRERNIRSKFLMREVLEEILQKLKNHKHKDTIHIFGFVGSESGRNLMTKSLQLRLVRKATSDEEMDLMDSHITIDDIKKIWLNLDRELIKSAHQEKDYRIFK